MERIRKALVGALGLAVLVGLLLGVDTGCGPPYEGQESTPGLSATPMTPPPTRDLTPGGATRPAYTPSPTEEPQPTHLASPTPAGTAGAPVPSGLSLVCEETDVDSGKTTLWLADVKDTNARRTLLTVEHKIGYGPSAAVSPDGRRIAYVVIPPESSEREARTSGGELWVANVEGTDLWKLADKVGFLGMWSPDSAALLHGRLVPLESPKDPQVPYRTEFWLILVKQARESLLVANDTDYGVTPVGWSSDGKLFYYAVVTLQGQWELWGVDMASRTQQLAAQLPWDLASGISLSPDGTRVVFSVYEERQPVPEYALVIVRVSDGEARTIISGAKGDQPVNRYAALWSPDSRTLIAHIPPEAQQYAQLARIDVTTGERWAILAGQPAAEEFFIPHTLSPSGEWLVVLGYPSLQPYLLSLSDGQMTAILPAEPSYRISFVGWAITSS